jgi:alkanesulfonate monooxygenase SsuD/methylene tetrahydromethanopterin reductase-like flavin-dependent oxidoreductase (luciferase family)
MKFGIAVLQSLPWQELNRIFQKMDISNFDGIWIADHFVNYANPTGSWFESWSLLAALANATSRIRFGTLITSISLRNPAVLARQALTVDHISNGRLELGIGAGAPGTVDPSYRMIGVDDWPFQERVKRLKEQVEIIDLLLRNNKASYNGEFYNLEDVLMAPEPVQKPRPPITIAAHVKASLRIAAEYADTWVSFGADFGSPPEIVVEKTHKRSEFLSKCCEKIGRDPATIGRSLLIFGSEGGTAFASEDHFIEIVDRYSAIGINEFVFFYPFFAPDQVPTLFSIAKNTIPTLR